MKRSKRSQTAAQVFTYIVAIVIIGIIFVFGFRAVLSLKNRGDQITEIRFQRELTSSIKTISSRYLDVEIKTFQLSQNYYEACFIRTYDLVEADVDPGEFDDYPLIWDSFESGSDNNLFLLDRDGTIKDTLIVSDVAFDDDSYFKCFKVSGSELKLRLEGRGDHAVISQG